MAEQKSCTRCGRIRPIEEFQVDPRRSDNRGSWCRDCRNEKNRKYRAGNLDRLRAQNRDGHKRRAAADPDYYVRCGLRATYRMTLEDYQAKLAAQGGVCAVCGQPPPEGKRLHVDHDHACCPGERSCGRCVRGLLCARCNGGTGIADDPELLRRKAAYILDWREKEGISASQLQSGDALAALHSKRGIQS